jgi:broad specificity phosphatase PhoE
MSYDSGSQKENTMLKLVRHAESSANVGAITSDYAAIPLTDLGHQQAAEFAQSLQHQPDWIGVSPFRRAKQTSEPLQSRFPSAPVFEMPVHEFTYISPSRCVNNSLADLKPHIDAYWDKLDPDHNDGEGAESFADLLSRAKAFLADAASRPGVGVVFTHAQFIRAIQLLVSAPPQSTEASLMQSFFNMRKTTPIPNVSATSLQLTPAEWTLLR